MRPNGSRTIQDVLEAHADFLIRRACAAVGLAGIAAMAVLAPHPVLALRTGAELAAFLVVGLALAAWRVPHRHLRDAGVFAVLRDAGLPHGRRAAEQVQAMLAGIFRDRLLWHAERVALVAMALWGLAVALWLLV